MKKRIVMMLALGMCMFLCACGGNEKNTEAEKDTIQGPVSLTVEEMKEYYDTEKYVGTPRYVTAELYDIPNNEFKVVDEFIRMDKAPKEGKINSYIILHPDAKAEVFEDTVKIKTPNTEVTLKVDGKITVEKCNYAFKYGERCDTTKLCITYPRDAKSASAIFTWNK